MISAELNDFADFLYFYKKGIDSVTMLCYTDDSNIVTLKNGGEQMSDLISKKELLEKYKISYGTLYRWKRMGLIPEDWLVKKSTFTGQETFFNRDLICKRVEEILSKKEVSSLGDIKIELGEKTAEIPKLRIVTSMGDKLFYLSDVRDVILHIGDSSISFIDEINKKINKSEEE